MRRMGAAAGGQGTLSTQSCKTCSHAKWERADRGWCCFDVEPIWRACREQLPASVCTFTGLTKAYLYPDVHDVGKACVQWRQPEAKQP